MFAFGRVAALLVLVLTLYSVSGVLSHQQWNYIDLINSPARIFQQSQQSSYNDIQLQALSSIEKFSSDIAINGIIGRSDFFTKLLPKLQDLENERNFTVNGKCINDTAYFIEGLLERKPGLDDWALRMIDAYGKPSSGLLDVNLLWVGDYEECLNVTYPVLGSNISTDSAFKGQYCSVKLPLTPTPPPMGGPTLFIGINMGVCFPDSCNSHEIIFLLNTALNILNRTELRFDDNMSTCQIQDREYDTKAVAAIVVGVLFAMILVIGTLYELLFLQLPKWLYTYTEEDCGVVKDKVEDAESMNIKHVVGNDEGSPLLGKTKASINLEMPEPSTCGKILLSFSAYSNGVKILSTKQPKGTLGAVHGIRFLSMTWVILGHTLVFGISVLENFATYFPPVLKGFAFQGIINATVSVDTFFTLSGLLVGYLTLKELKKNEGKLNWFMFYFHRYWRLTPPYMLLMLIYVSLFPYVTDGPLWPQAGVEINQCSGSWWTNLLYVNNLVKKTEMCMGWSWYLANDMQFFILSPLIIIPLYYSKVLGLVVSSMFLLATTITAGVISSSYGLGAGIASPTANGTGQLDFMMEYYFVPYCRMGPYIIGLLAGYYMYSTELRVRWSKMVVIIGWSVSIASGLAVVYGLYDVSQGHPLTVDTAAFYNAVNRTVWGVCVSWVVVACAAGYGGPVNVLLSWKGFIPLSRLTYCAYLIHPIVMYAFYFGQKKPFYFTNSLFVFLFFGFLVASYMAAFLLSLMFEAPMMGLENVIFKRQKR